MALSLPLTWGEAIQITRTFVGQGAPSREIEELIFAALLRAEGSRPSRLELFSAPERPFPREAARMLVEFARRRGEGEPLQYITGVQAFLDHEYQVGPGVLIPRPETEILATVAIQELAEGAEPSLGLEIGVGSGVLSVELLSRFHGLRIVGSEFKPEAASYARSNAERILGHGSTRLEILPVPNRSEVAEPLLRELKGRKADFLISNPPYLAGFEEAEAGVVKHEPEEALFAPALDPLHFYRGMATHARALLRASGRIFLEIPHERAEEIQRLFTSMTGPARLVPDLTGRPRVLVAEVAGTIDRDSQKG